MHYAHWFCCNIYLGLNCLCRILKQMHYCGESQEIFFLIKPQIIWGFQLWYYVIQLMYFLEKGLWIEIIWYKQRSFKLIILYLIHSENYKKVVHCNSDFFEIDVKSSFCGFKHQRKQMLSRLSRLKKCLWT